ncbi:DUF7079 family protein [Spartinivicinus ruber]|uniref:DUF7079 family protein n=1 Tax=Spartinivicinus ruber TaxID=2683272 RepID=UPI0013D8CC63|nr:hypothetical protein [Spartinivicinus ruber]
MNKLELYLLDGNRLHAWVILAQLFAEVGLSEQILSNLAGELQTTQIEQQDLYDIYHYEVAPCFLHEQWFAVK